MVAEAAPVFLSYATEDAAAARAVCRAIEGSGIRCFLASRDIRPGSSWAADLVTAIGGCRVLVVLCSRSALRSEHVLREVTQAVRRGRHLLPVRLDAYPLTPSFEYLIGTAHWVDASGQRLVERLGMIVEAVRTIIGGTWDAARNGGGLEPGIATGDPAAGQMALDDVFTSPQTGRVVRWIRKLMEDK